MPWLKLLFKGNHTLQGHENVKRWRPLCLRSFKHKKFQQKHVTILKIGHSIRKIRKILTMHQMTKEISNLWGKLKMERPRNANTHVSERNQRTGRLSQFLLQFSSNLSKHPQSHTNSHTRSDFVLSLLGWGEEWMVEMEVLLLADLECSTWVLGLLAWAVTAGWLSENFTT